MKITYKISGRFGNNLFQYIAVKIIQYLLPSYQYVYNSDSVNKLVITDEDYLYYFVDHIDEIDVSKDILLDGYYQFDRYILKYKEYIMSILTVDNHERINNTYLVSDIYKIHPQLVSNETLVIHLRLDDFLTNYICMKPEHCVSMINDCISKINITKIIIIVDKLRQTFEFEYLKVITGYLMTTNISFELQSNSLLVDFSILYNATNFISSNSTFSYLAGLLGKHTNSWCPVNTRYSHQLISKFDDNTESIIIDYL